MNPRTTVWLVAIALGLFAYIYFGDLRSTDSDADTGGPGRLLPEFELSSVTSVQVIRTNETISAEVINDQWHLTHPPYPAQAAVIEAFLQGFAQLTRHQEISGKDVADAGGLAPFGLEPPSAVVKIAAGTNSIQLRVGAKTLVGDRVYVQAGGSKGVATTDASMLEHLPAASAVWRNPLLIHEGNLAFDGISITTGSRPLRLERDRATQLWRLVQPMPVRRADFGRVEYLIQQLFRARVTQFVTDNPRDDLEPFGLQAPEAELTLWSGTNAVCQLQFGKSPPNDPAQVYVRRMSHTNVVLIARELGDLVQKPYTEFRDRSLLSFRPAAVHRIEAQADEAFAVQRSAGNDWQIVEPFQAPADRQLMQLFLEDLARLEIVRFEKDVVTDFSPYGLAEPARHYTLMTTLTNSTGITNATLLKVDFGSTPTNELDTVYCRRADENSVYVVAFADMFRLERAGYALRDRRVWSFASSNVTSVTTIMRGQKRELTRDPATRQWDKANPVLNAAIEETLHRLGQLEADSWSARGQDQAERFGAAGSKFQLVLGLNEQGKSRRLTVSFGNLASSGQPYAAVVLEQGEPVVFKFPAQLYGLVAEYLSIPSVGVEE
ncbi:MAG: DUF4340 domain-containing protein [Verrucomicrobiia bacterium]